MFDKVLIGVDGRSGGRDAIALAAQRRVAGGQAETVVRLDGPPGRGLHQIAEHEHADLLVVGSSHRGALGRETSFTATRRCSSCRVV
jgi:nucleotide-binding universal stress UspA family protein